MKLALKGIDSFTVLLYIIFPFQDFIKRLPAPVESLLNRLSMSTNIMQRFWLSIKYSSPVLFFLLAVLPLLASCTHKDVKVEEMPAKPWSFYQSGIRHDGFAETDFTPSLGKKWMKPVEAGSKPYAPQEYASPAASNDIVYFASLRGKGVSAYKAKTGELIWYFPVEKSVESSPAIYE